VCCDRFDSWLLGPLAIAGGPRSSRCASSTHDARSRTKARRSANGDRTLGGQLWGIVGLSVPCVPIMLAGDVPALLTMEAWGTWLIGFGATTLAVRGVIAAQKRQSRVLHWSVIGGLSVAVATLTLAGFKLPIVTLPMISMSWYFFYAPPPATQLKRVGWTLVGATFASACWMAVIV
jgi:hypothetical protein